MTIQTTAGSRNCWKYSRCSRSVLAAWAKCIDAIYNVECMELALNAGFGDPIQHELAFIASLGFTVVRQDPFAHGDGAPIEALVAEFAGQAVRPLFLLAGGKIAHDDGAGRIEPHELAARATRLVAAANACALVSYAVEVGNEPDIAHDDYASRPQDFAEAVRQSHEALRVAGFDGPVISGGVSNLNERGLDYLSRMLATGTVPSDVIVGFHRDRKSTRLNSSHLGISYAVFCLKKKKK